MIINKKTIIKVKIMAVKRDKFDFEIGFFHKSPCKNCDKWEKNFPGCENECEILDRIHGRLAGTISCTKG
jgi:hypothetical protein